MTRKPSSAVACPDQAALEVFVADGERDGELARHVAQCDACGEAVRRVREENALLRQYAPPDAAVRVRAVSSDFQLRGYDIVRELHRGGQGVVYHAVQRSTRRDVAVKVLRAGPFAGLADRARFEREVQVLAQLQHPSIVAIHDSGVVEGSHYFVMDFVRGLPLDDFLAGPGEELDRRARLELMAQVCEAVNAAHLRGIIHRDLKPSNVLVEWDAGDGDASSQEHGGEPGSVRGSRPGGDPRATRPTPKVLDFGLAKLTSTEGQASMMTLTGHFVGTPQWASPEQLVGGAMRVDLRSDVYSLGVILYQVLTGSFPYDVSGAWHEVASRIQRIEPAPLRRSRRDFDDDLNTIVMKCLAREPERRYETAGALARDIRHYLAGQAIDAKRESTWYVLRKTVRRYRLMIGAVAASFVVLLLFAAAMSVAYRRAHVAEQAAAQRSVELTAALVQANIEQGRAQGLLGNVPSAEDLLWRELLSTSSEAPGLASTDPAFWGLLELYARYPCRETFRVLEGERRGVRITDGPISGHLLAVAPNGRAEWWDCNSGRLVEQTRIEIGKALDRAATWTRGGGALFESDAGICLVSLRDRSLRRLAVERESATQGLDLSRDGRRLAVADPRGAIQLFDVPEQGPVRLAIRFVAHELVARRVAWLDTRPALLSAGDEDRLAQWNLDTDPPELRWSLPARSQSIFAVSADEQFVAYHRAGPESIACVHVADGVDASPPTEPLLAKIGVLTFSPDAELLLAAASLRSELRLYRRATGELAGLLLGHRAHVVTGGFTSDGARIVSLDAGNVVKLWEPSITGGWMLRRDRGASVMSVAFADDGAALLQATGDGRVFLTRVDGAAPDSALPPLDAPTASILPMPERRQVVTANYDGVIRLWERVDPAAEPVATIRLGVQINQLALGPSGKWLAAACDDGSVAVCELGSGRARRLEGHAQRVATVAVSGDGRVMASGDGDGRLLLRSGRDHAVHADIAAAHARSIRTAVFTPDGRLLATGGDDNLVRLWDPSTGAAVRTFAGHENAVFALAWRPDGRVLASGDSTGTIILWDAQSGRNLAQFKPHTAMIFSLAFSPDGRRLASGSGDRSCAVEDLARLERFVVGNLEAAIERLTDLDRERVSIVRQWAAALRR